VVWKHHYLRDERPAIKQLNRGTALTFVFYRTNTLVFSSSKEQLRLYYWIPTRWLCWI